MKRYLALMLLAVSALVVTSCQGATKAPAEEQTSQSTEQQDKVPTLEDKPITDKPAEDKPVANEPVEDSKTPPAESDTTGEVAEEVGVYPGMLAPELILKDRDNNEVKLSDYVGKIVFLNFWATTCPYCVDEMPDLETFYQNHKDDLDIVLLGVNMTKTWEKKSKDELIKWVDGEGITFPTVYDEDGVEAERWMAHSLPVTYVINKDGRSLGALMGKTSLDTFEGVLDEVRASN